MMAASCLTRKGGLFSLGLIAAASEGKKGSLQKTVGRRNYVAVTFAIIHLTCLKSRLCSPRLEGWDSHERLTSGKTVKFRGLSAATGASLSPCGLFGALSTGGAERESSALALLTQPYCHSLS